MGHIFPQGRVKGLAKILQRDMVEMLSGRQNTHCLEMNISAIGALHH